MQWKCIGASRRLTYGDGTTFIETVVDVEPNGIVLELSEHPFPCSKLYAHLFSEKVEVDTSTFGVALLFNFAEGTDEGKKTWFNNANQGLVNEIANNVKNIFETDSYKQLVLEGNILGTATGKLFEMDHTMINSYLFYYCFCLSHLNCFAISFVSTSFQPTVPAKQEAINPLFFDLVKIQDYHPWLGTSVIQTEQKGGVGKFFHFKKFLLL